ncbi:class I SAM-dependent methyltransferase [Chondrinema litorale]|uniref:class I SAM-dependent methyltransferase n=1 Tax=Chondrinema litorale TaxID=2994555 RepID=UPI002543B55B|nr:class I SAM-dependent methyltransferase [Chondrinema litorale]UZR92969.1 class I SAM-dependent methyltransferase [Chondrinema litorale]
MQRIEKASWDFVHKYQKIPPSELLLKKQLHEGVDINWAVKQIEARQKAEKKLPSWFNNKEIEFPVRLSMEQSSSEATASYKANLLEGERLIDLTGGFGVDAFHFCKNFKEVFYCERDEDLCRIAEYNSNVLAINNLTVKQGDSLEVLKDIPFDFDVIYLDPARRDANQKKVVSFADCQPDVIENKNFLLSKAEKVLIKASPMLDIPQALRELDNVTTVFVVAVENEVKELLFLLERSPAERVKKVAVNIVKDDINEFESTDVSNIDFSETLNYLYEPNVALLKAGLQNEAAAKYHLLKLHPNSHLYTSTHLFEDFPGRVFNVDQLLKVKKKLIQKEIPGKKANITVRNFPMNVADIRKKTGLKEGGEIYLFATTLLNNDKVLIKCSKP